MTTPTITKKNFLESYHDAVQEVDAAPTTQMATAIRQGLASLDLALR